MVYTENGGEGKTSILNCVEEQLLKEGKKDKISIAHFNPWLVGSEEAMLKEFFQALLVYPDEKVRQFFQQYGSLSIMASKTIGNVIAPGVGTLLSAGLEAAKEVIQSTTPTIYQLKQKVSKAIKSSGKHLLVIVDDLDRLDNNEVRCALRLIRQVADFENVIYLVAMDVEMVSKSIAQYYGGGSLDGRKFIDKIVQVPITIPAVPKLEFDRIVQEDLSGLLKGYTSKEEILHISEAVAPLMQTRRELLRYCNQLNLVLPGLKDEVNTLDLCIVEAIKNISYDAYQSIYNNRSTFLYEINMALSTLNVDNKVETALNQRYDRAVEDIVSRFGSPRKEVVTSLIKRLFPPKTPYVRQKDYDEKRICTPTYFSKYFTHLVPSDVISDTELNLYLKSFSIASIDDTTRWIDEKIKQYSLDEAERALIYFIQHCSTAEKKRTMASKLAISLSISSAGKGLPYHPDAVWASAIFVTNRLIQTYFTKQDPDYAGFVVLDKDLLSATLFQIFSRAELYFGLNLLPSLNNFLRPKDLDLKEPIGELARRFKAIPFEEQMRYSKFLLQVFFYFWRTFDATSFDEYANSIVVNHSFSIVVLLKHFIDNRTVAEDVDRFVNIFENQIDLVNRRIKELSDKDKECQAVKYYCANYEVSLDVLKKRRRVAA